MTIKLILALVVQFYWKLEQLDVKTIFFFHGELEEKIYMIQHQVFKVKQKKIDFVCKLDKTDI